MSATKEQIQNALKDVKYPGLSRDIISFGMVKDIRIEDNTVFVHLSITTSDRNVKPTLERDVTECLLKLDGIVDVKVEVASIEPPKAIVEPTRYFDKIPRVFVVASGKGGVGKSTVAANLASSYARQGHSVGLLDADIYGPSIQLMMGVDSKPTVRNQKIVPVDAHGVTCMSLGMLVDPDQAMVWRGPMVIQAFEQLMRDVDWPELDVMIIDLPPGTGDIQLTLSQKVDVDGAVIVTTPQEVALADARKAVNMFQKVNVPILGFVENMAYYVCKSCGTKDYIFGKDGARGAAKKMKVPFLGELPLDTRIREAGDEGEPAVIRYEEHAGLYDVIVENIGQVFAKLED